MAAALREAAVRRKELTRRRRAFASVAPDAAGLPVARDAAREIATAEARAAARARRVRPIATLDAPAGIAVELGVTAVRRAFAARAPAASRARAARRDRLEEARGGEAGAPFRRCRVDRGRRVVVRAR